MSTTITADDLRVGDRLEDDWGDELIVTDVSGGKLTWEVEGEHTETHSLESVQSSFDHGEIEMVERGDAGSEEADSEREPEEISDTDPEEVSDADLYVRFGNIPEGEQSYDNRNDRYEDGVSVYACERDSTDEDAPAELDEAYYLSGTMLQTVFGLMFRDTYLVTGERVGTGADGEPLLEDVEVVAKLSSPEGIGGWVVDEEAEG